MSKLTRLDKWTDAHLKRWAEGIYPDDAHLEMTRAITLIRRFVQHNPDVLERLSWPEILRAARDESDALQHNEIMNDLFSDGDTP